MRCVAKRVSLMKGKCVLFPFRECVQMSVPAVQMTPSDHTPIRQPEHRTVHVRFRCMLDDTIFVVIWVMNGLSMIQFCDSVGHKRSLRLLEGLTTSTSTHVLHSFSDLFVDLANAGKERGNNKSAQEKGCGVKPDTTRNAKRKNKETRKKTCASI